MQVGTVPRHWFCRRPWRFKINIRRTPMHFRKSNICANELDVQETNFSFTQFYRSWNHFSRCRFTHGRYSRSLSLWDLVIEVFHSSPNKTNKPKDVKEPQRNPSADVSQTCATKSQPSTPTSIQQTLITFRHTKTFWSQCYAVCFWGQWDCNQNDNQRSKSHNEACFTNSQSCFRLVVWQDYFEHQDPNPLHWH